MADNGDKDVFQSLGSMVQDAIDSREFAELRTMVERTATAAGEGVRKAQEAVAASMTEARRKEEERLARERVAARYGSAAGLRVTGGIAALFGAMLTLTFVLGVIGALALPWVDVGLLATIAVFLFLSACLLRAGLDRLALARRFDAYRRVIGSREACTVAELSHQVGRKADAVRADARRLIVKGLLREGRLSSSGRTLVVTEAAFAAVEEQERAAAEARRATRAQRVEAKVERVEPAPASEDGLAPFSVDDAPEEVRPLLRRGAAYLAELDEANAAIDDDAVSAKVDRLSLIHI